MPYHVEITPKENYLHVEVTGDATYENAVDLWRKVAAACKSQNCFNVLGEQHMSNAISTMDAWNHQTIFLEAGITAKFLIAWADKNPKTFVHTEFIRTVLSNRDIGYGRLFSDVEKAQAWLLKKLANKKSL